MPCRNPRALVREPLTMDEYMSVRMISSPLCLYDCDRFSDASTVLIVSAGDAVDEVSCKPVRIAAMAGTVERLSWDRAERMACYPHGCRSLEAHGLQALGRRYGAAL